MAEGPAAERRDYRSASHQSIQSGSERRLTTGRFGTGSSPVRATFGSARSAASVIDSSISAYFNGLSEGATRRGGAQILRL